MSLKNICAVGVISKIPDEYVITTEDGTRYRLSAIMPYEAVSPDFDRGGLLRHLAEEQRLLKSLVVIRFSATIMDEKSILASSK
ncbi:MAG: hypothetical protein EAX81_07065 [Candidatus Thorarchaeota archaeon]|nr:hypothetical protein [Candidatus Thorarchaeota archaeon]